MSAEKHKHTVWLPDSTWDEVEDHYKVDNCATKNEFIEKAIRFYCGYLNADEDGNFLPATLSRELDGKLSILAKRISRMLFKLSVDQAMMCNLVSYMSDVSLDALKELRVKCVQDVKQTNGEIDLVNAFKFQKDVE